MNDTSLRIMQLSGQGYCCAQIMLRLCLDLTGEENPALVRAAEGLCLGLGDCSGVCGILSGGICAIAMYLGKGADMDDTDERLPAVVDAYREWFVSAVIKDHGGVTCRDIVGSRENAPAPGTCGPLLEAAYAKVIACLTDAGVDPTSPRDADDSF